MGTLKEYQCNGCGYTVTGTRKGRTLGMMGEIETEKVPRKCPKCGGDMKETGTVIMIDQDKTTYIWYKQKTTRIKTR